MFFLERKNQKTLVLFACAIERLDGSMQGAAHELMQQPSDKSFLVLFFKKEHLAS
jgi:hypothetical protein